VPVNKYNLYGEPARQMYLEGKTAKQIAQVYDVTEKTISEWKALGDWDARREEARKIVQSDEEIVKGLLRKFLRELSNKAMSHIRPADLDMLSKLTSTLRSIQTMLDPRAATVFVIRNFTGIL
jgi:hypothetical protein